MTTDNAHRVAIVTGAGRGIGRACAIALAQAGFSVCLAARTREQLEQTRNATGLPPERSLIVLLDLAQAEAPAALPARHCRSCAKTTSIKFWPSTCAPRSRSRDWRPSRWPSAEPAPS